MPHVERMRGKATEEKSYEKFMKHDWDDHRYDSQVVGCCVCLSITK